MPLTAGTRLGSYEVTALIGVGGMGEVYRSRDLKLKRDVAIKVLPGELSRDPERIQRFRHEAEVLATLNHPHIAQIYGLEEGGGGLCLVLELAEGETLAQRLSGGALRLDEALGIAIQIADALESAHERGIVHRDLKPANIKVSSEGNVKVLDFGLAKAMDTERVDAGTSQSPTMLSGSMPGMIVGTAGYMSPEQVKGRPADARSDVWSFGCVLFEMLTGRRGFAGETAVEILGEVLRSDPDWSALPSETPPSIRSLLRRCLQKDRIHRQRDIADARFLLEEVLKDPATSAVAAMHVSSSSTWRRWLSFATTTVIIAATGVLYFRPVVALEDRRHIITPPANAFTSFAVSPDGRKLVFEGVVSGKSQLFLHHVGTESSEPIAGSENVNNSHPFWSHDGESLGFFAGGQLKRIAITGGATQTIGPASSEVYGGDWNPDGDIIFSPNATSPILRISARGGGDAVPVTPLDSPRQVGHRYPHFLPDGRHFVFYVLGDPEVRGVYVGSLDPMEPPRRLFDSDTAAVFARPDSLLFAREGALYAQQFDLKSRSTAGEPFHVADQVAQWTTYAGDVAVSATATGTIAFRSRGVKRQLAWYDRSGKHIEIGEPDTAAPSDLRLSPDGKRVAVSRVINGNSDVWFMEIGQNIWRPLTRDAAYDGAPLWSPEGDSLLFSSRRSGRRVVWQIPVTGMGTETLFYAPTVPVNAIDWSRNYLLHVLYAKATGSDLWALPVDDDRKPGAALPVANSRFAESTGRFSPDGQWIAYESDEGGQNDIWIRGVPDLGRPVRLTDKGGTNPQWGRSGEMFYLSADNDVMALVLQRSEKEVSGVESTTRLFKLPPGSEYETSPDGRFLVNMPIEDAVPITLISNWAGRH